jgi:predicted Fe-Mo cluster-binding NifX family protein
MKIAVASAGDTLEAPLDARFGRCAYFVIVDPDTLDFEAASNPAVTAGQGAGIQAAQIVADRGADVVIADNIGPNAYQALTAGGVQIVRGARGTVRKAVEQYQAGQLTPVAAPTVAGNFGRSVGPGGPTGAGPGRGGGGWGGGRGGGRGWRGGRGS